MVRAAAHLVHTEWGSLAESNGSLGSDGANELVRACSSSGERSVHIGKVVGSTPTSPTSSFPTSARADVVGSRLGDAEQLPKLRCAQPVWVGSNDFSLLFRDCCATIALPRCDAAARNGIPDVFALGSWN